MWHNGQWSNPGSWPLVVWVGFISLGTSLLQKTGDIYCQNVKQKTKNWKKRERFERFKLSKVRGKKKEKKNVRFIYVVFSLCSQTYRRIIKKIVFYFWFYSQIWLNLFRDDHQFFLHLPMNGFLFDLVILNFFFRRTIS